MAFKAEFLFFGRNNMSFAVVLRLQLVFLDIRKETKSALAQSLDATFEGRMSPTAKKANVCFFVRLPFLTSCGTENRLHAGHDIRK